MAFKQNPNKKVQLQDMNKTALIKTVKTLRARETKLLNQIAKLRVLDVSNLKEAVEFGYHAGELGKWSFETTVQKWFTLNLQPTETAAEDMTQKEISAALPDSTPRHLLPWEVGK